jgi:hydroxymethylbilane synthase
VDARARDAVALIGDAAAGDALAAERALVAALGGGCQTPVGALASVDGDAIDLIAVVVALDGTRIVRGRDRAPRADAAALGRRVGRQLIADGAADILAEAQRIQNKSQASSLNSQP